MDTENTDSLSRENLTFSINNEQCIKRELIQRKILELESIYELNKLYLVWRERMLQLASVHLQPDSSEPIEEPALPFLDYIWELGGERWTNIFGCEFEKRALEAYVGRKVKLPHGLGVIRRMYHGKYGIKMFVYCGKCNKTRMAIYACPGLYRGAFCLVFNKSGRLLANLSKEWVTCGRCIRKKKRKQKEKENLQ